MNTWLYITIYADPYKAKKELGKKVRRSIRGIYRYTWRFDK
jgi:hypothetical protein